MATIAVDEYYQAVKIQFANELPSANVGFGAGYSKMPYTTNSDWGFSTPAFASYELDLFLKNRDKTKASKKITKLHYKMNALHIYLLLLLLVQLI